MTTFRAIVDRGLQQSGQLATGSDNAFNSDTTLTKIQYQAKYYFDLVHRRVMRDTKGRWLEREYSLTLDAVSSNIFNCPAGTSPERVIEKSFRITSPVASAGKLIYRSYQDWVDQYPASDEGTGIPVYWFVRPPTALNADTFGFSPPPNGAFTVKFRAYLKAVALTAATDVISIPTEFEDLVLLYMQQFIETALAEGKAVDFAQFIDPTISAVKQLSMGPPEELPGIDIGIQVWGRNKPITDV